MKIRPLQYCQIPNDPSRVCAGGVMQGTTQGDSGGPLMAIQNHEWYEMGVASAAGLKSIDQLSTRSMGKHNYSVIKNCSFKIINKSFNFFRQSSPFF